MRNLTILAAVLTASTGCIATGDDLQVDEPAPGMTATWEVHGRLLANEVIQIEAQHSESGAATVDGVVLDRHGRLLGELTPSGAVGELATEISLSELPRDRADVGTLGLIVELYTAEGVVSSESITIDISSLTLSR